MTTEYNGWKNYETWNVALWLNNDEYLYDMTCKSRISDYSDLLKALPFTHTPDDVDFHSPEIDTDAMDALIRENQE